MQHQQETGQRERLAVIAIDTVFEQRHMLVNRERHLVIQLMERQINLIIGPYDFVRVSNQIFAVENLEHPSERAAIRGDVLKEHAGGVMVARK